ncbi:MAG TPA: sigma 54-interacting transcriptional regulator [Labilithrix sp.]|nr:sigma 54-interacting transcriptional regulator [Labilithrix sp.]
MTTDARPDPSPLRLPTHRLVVASGPDAGRSTSIDGPTFVVGSSPTADLRLSDDRVAPEHLRLSLHSDGVRVRDLDTNGGTWMGTLRINDVILSKSTSFLLGETTLVLQIEDGPPVDHADATKRFGEAIGESSAMRRLFSVLEQASSSDVSVLINGESGVGKDVLATALHARSERAGGRFVAVDCGAISPSLIESELFGHERGAFTGADCQRVGAFVQADGGTLFLDEIGELPIDLQPKLLRTLESREVRPVGARSTRPVDVRIIAATNRNLAQAVSANEFRRDLYYRLAVLRVDVPPLRERKEDILPLARAFLKRISGHETATIPPELEALLLSYSWPGNVRELKNIIHRYAVLGTASPLFTGEPSGANTSSLDDLSHLSYQEARAVALERFERTYVPSVLTRVGNVVAHAALHAGVRRASFHRMLKRIRERDN